jgi:thioredoxin 1
MAVCCIGGVCIPYTALIPLLLYGIKWFVEKLMEYGLLPKWLHEKINQLLTTGNTQKSCHVEGNSSNNVTTTSSSSCCPSRSSNSRLRRRRHNETKEIVNSHSTLSCDENDKQQENDNNHLVNDIVITIQSAEQWHALFDSITNNIVVCKFTAEWCKPCKEIHPLFHELATQYTCHTNNKDDDTNKKRVIQFCIIDVDNDALEEVIGAIGVAILPTFCIFDSNTKPINKYIGSDPKKLKELIVNTIDKTQ